MRARWLGGIAALLCVAPLAAPAAEPGADGKALFQYHCGLCHRQGGTGTFMLGRRLGQDNALLEGRTNLNTDYVRTVVRNGINSMPRFARPELPDEDLLRIARYLTEKAAP
jgi:mono/diheme cytochrome c family protein